uniref:Beta-galactoside alpha--sialyltransferase 2 n=1 Tax=Tetraselmis sp. GSL018 TaxID=582737 RepID=A0A061R6Q7_9CHLO
MYRDGFFGSFVMNQAKYSRYSDTEPIRIPKFKSQCAFDQWPSPSSPPRGCDTAAATGDPPRSRGYDRIAVAKPELLKLLPPQDVFRQMPKFKTCAVVGNGGSLLMNDMGATIDRHQAVIRFNGGITRGFERWVGSRTTFRILNTQHIGFQELNGEILLQHATSLSAMEDALVHKIKHPNVTMFITDGDFHQYVLDEMGDGAASNGFYGVVFANEICEKVTLYGFYKSWGPKGDGGSSSGGGGPVVKYHYYDRVEPNQSQKSRDDKETPALLDFLSRHREKFELGEPTAVGAS